MGSYADAVMVQAKRLQKYSGDVGFISLVVHDYGLGLGEEHILTEWLVWDGGEHVHLKDSSFSALVSYIDQLIIQRELLFKKF